MHSHSVNIQVIGEIWQPGVGPCAMDLTARCTDLLGGFTRDSVQDWLDCHAGDFQIILDFAAIHGPEEIPWANEESELTYNDCMDPMPEEEYA
jgi:hypothetical protein